MGDKTFGASVAALAISATLTGALVLGASGSTGDAGTAEHKGSTAPVVSSTRSMPRSADAAEHWSHSAQGSVVGHCFSTADAAEHWIRSGATIPACAR